MGERVSGKRRSEKKVGMFPMSAAMGVQFVGDEKRQLLT